MNWNTNLDAQLAHVFGDAPRPKPINRMSHEELDRSLRAENERQAWVEKRLPVAIAEREAVDAHLELAISDAFIIARVPAPMLAAYRTGDDAELGRLFRKQIASRMAEKVEQEVDDSSFDLFPEAL